MFFLLQFAGLDLQQNRSSSGRYVPPHLRNKHNQSAGSTQAESSNSSSINPTSYGDRDRYDRDRDRGQDSRDSRGIH